MTENSEYTGKFSLTNQLSTQLLVGVRNFTLFVKFSASMSKARSFLIIFTFEASFAQKLAPPNFRCIIKRWQILCRYVQVFRQLNSINHINHNLNFCEARSSIPLVKLIFTKTHFIKFPRVLPIFSAFVRNPIRGISWSRVTRFSNLDFSTDFPNFFKLSSKMLYLV